jgi:hypothetical protein
VQGPPGEHWALFALAMHLPLGHCASAVQKQLVCVESQLKLVFLYALLVGHPYPAPTSAGMPGLANSQSNPSRGPVPVQLPAHERSLSPVILTHLPLLHWLSLEQKQPPGDVHSLVLPLQLPNGHT